jgi:hypothetical protein
MRGVENRFLEATDDLGPLAGGGILAERSLILEEKLQEIAVTLFEDPLLAFRAVKAYAERQIREHEASRAARTPATGPDRPGFEVRIHSPALAYATEAPAQEHFRLERATFEAIKPRLEGQEGRYVVIKGDEVAGVWPSYEEALDGGYDRFGLVAFFVKQLTASSSSPRSKRGGLHAD